MNISEILNEIHNENFEVEIYKALSEWIVLDRQRRIVEATRCKSAIRAIKKINRGKNKDIDSLCEVEE